jgi:hypothetical protein
METIKNTVSNLWNKIVPPAQQIAQNVADSTGVSNTTLPGTASEAPGTTTTGGRRRSKTRRHRKGKKTHKRKH